MSQCLLWLFFHETSRTSGGADKLRRLPTAESASDEHERAAPMMRHRDKVEFAAGLRGVSVHWESIAPVRMVAASPSKASNPGANG
jgi:hypothetical protein